MALAVPCSLPMPRKQAGQYVSHSSRRGITRSWNWNLWERIMRSNGCRSFRFYLRQSSSSRFVYTIDRATTACLHFGDAPVGDSLKCNGSLLNLTGRSAYCFCWLLEDFRCWSNSDGWQRLHKLYWQKQELPLTQSVYRIHSEYTPCASANCYSRYPNASI